jgi:hypothetical protein
MQDLDIEQRFHLMQKEIESTASVSREAKLDLTSAMDSLKLEIEVLKIFMERYHPDFKDSYPDLKQEAMQAIDPEWTTVGTGKKS